jgi:hypothetical protein
MDAQSFLFFRKRMFILPILGMLIYTRYQSICFIQSRAWTPRQGVIR